MTPTTLMKYDAACQALAAASRVDEAKDIRDRAEAVRVYAKQAKNLDLERQATEIRLRAERRTGELLKESAENGQRETRGGDRKSPANPKSKSQNGTLIPKLVDLGISKRQSSDWQKMAAIPAPDFETRVKAVVETQGKATTATILKEPAEFKRSAGYLLNRPTPNGHQVDEVASGLQWFIRQGDYDNALYCAAEIVHHIGGEDHSGYTFIWNRLLIIASEDVGLADPMAAPLVLSLYGTYLALKDQGKFRESLLQMTQAIFTLAYTQKSRMMDTATIAFFSALKVSLQKRRELPTEAVIARQSFRELPDVVFDKHTTEGRVRRKRGSQHFWDKKTHLVDEIFFNPDGTPTDPYLAQAKAVTEIEEMLGKEKTGELIDA